MTIDTLTTGDLPDQRSGELLDALNDCVNENERQGSPLMGKIDKNVTGLMGWSMGGGGTLIAASQTPTLKAVIGLCAWGPHSGDMDKVPALMFEGTADALAASMSDSYYQAIPDSVPKMLFEVAGADHFYANDPATDDGIVGLYGLSWMKVFLERRRGATSTTTRSLPKAICGRLLVFTAGRRILPIERVQGFVQRGMLRAQLVGLVEEVLGDDGEELSFIDARVLIDERALTTVGARAQLEELSLEHFVPTLPFFGRDERWSAIGMTIEHVELVRELVVDEVVSITRSLAIAQHAIPRQHYGALEVCLAQERARPLSDQRAGPDEHTVASSRPHDRAWIDQDRLDVLVQAMRQLEHEQACLRGDRDLHLLGELKAAAAFPMLLGDEHLHEITQTLLIVWREPQIVLHVAFEHRHALGRKRPLEEFPTLLFSPPIEHRRECSAPNQS